MNNKRKDPFQQQAEQNTDAVALQTARSIQTPGQTKEQTRAIAQGIAKGIAQYKRQQNEKTRERERARKRQLRAHGRSSTGEESIPTPPTAEREGPGNRPACWTAAVIFAAASALHLARWLAVLQVTLGNWTLPLWWSLPIAGLSGLLAIWLYVAGAGRGLRS